jgi:hypothetical protein
MAMDTERQRLARKWVWGCTGGCLGCIVLVLLGIYVAFRYYMYAVPVVPPQVFLTRASSAFLFVRVDPQVPLTMETALDVALQPDVHKRIPTKSGGPLPLDRRTAAEYIASFAPLQAVAALEPGEEESAIHGGLALSVGRGSRLLNVIVGAKFKTLPAVSEYRGARIAAAGPDACVALRGNNYMSADNEELLKTWAANLKMERQREQAAPSGPEAPAPALTVSPALGRAYERLDAGLPIVFACLNAHGELASLAELVPGGDARRIIESTEIASDNVVSLAGQVKPLSPRDGELTLFIDCAGPGAAARMKDGLDAAAREAGDKWPLKETEVTLEAPALVVVKGRIEDLPAKVAGIVSAAVERVVNAPKAAPPSPQPPPAQAPSVST